MDVTAEAAVRFVWGLFCQQDNKAIVLGFWCHLPKVSVGHKLEHGSQQNANAAVVSNLCPRWPPMGDTGNLAQRPCWIGVLLSTFSSSKAAILERRRHVAVLLWLPRHPKSISFAFLLFFFFAVALQTCWCLNFADSGDLEFFARLRLNRSVLAVGRFESSYLPRINWNVITLVCSLE